MIGIFGGTFNPVHYGHLRSALEVKDIFDLAEIRLIPSANPPHRDLPSVSAESRLKMLQLAIDQQTDLKIDDRELNRAGPSYMVDTLKSIRSEIGSQPLILFIGSDAFNQLTTWHEWQALFNYAHIVVLTRPNYHLQALNDFFSVHLSIDRTELAQNSAGKLYFQSVRQLDISATAIRDMIAQHKNPGFLLPDKVLTYIRQHQLYLR